MTGHIYFLDEHKGDFWFAGASKIFMVGRRPLQRICVCAQMLS
jgi:hypothetical protein